MDLREWLNEILNALPVPQNIFQLLWAAIGWQAGAAFGKSLDEDILRRVRKHKWLRKFYPFIARVLHFIHHWWIGGLIVIYFGAVQYYPNMPHFYCPELFWFGIGLAIQDLQYHLRESLTKGTLSRWLATR